MIVSLRIMNFGFLISVIVAVLIIGISRDATAQPPEVECPCDFDSVPMTPGCWTDNNPSDPEYTSRREDEECKLTSSAGVNGRLAALSVSLKGVEAMACRTEVRELQSCDTLVVKENQLTPEEVLACQCELLAYTTALNEVAGISVSPDPPYECGNVDCRQKVLTPIPTLNEYGMIITAGVLGLLAVIGLFVIRRRKVSA